MSPRPKYVAAVDFSCATKHFKAGDTVVDPTVLEIVLQHGDTFVTTDTARSRKAEAPTSNKEA